MTRSWRYEYKSATNGILRLRENGVERAVVSVLAVPSGHCIDTGNAIAEALNCMEQSKIAKKDKENQPTYKFDNENKIVTLLNPEDGWK